MLAVYFEKFEQYCKPKNYVIYARYKFKCGTQGDDETFEQFNTDLRVFFNDCSYDHNIGEKILM